ncbi:DUF397 domain-containing protein [Streptomyces sp. NPDC018321]|uniref:DUF397 domain-containing protein n=1 Tax=unclassified Streptomyces TaxID=2593676 RepID=UPI00379C9309
MTTFDNWRKSSYSGEGDGNSCVEVANSSTRVALRDSKAREYGTLSLPAEAFSVFVRAIKGAEKEL